MSEASEKVLGIKHLPLFPLPLVLLPNEMLPLHIFEPRYRQMLADIALKKNLFGISFFDPNVSDDDKPPVGSVGCVAEVREINRLEDGRANILTLGIIRYRLLDYVDAGDPYYVGEVEFFEDEEENESLLMEASDEVFVLFSRIAEAAHKLSNQQGELPQIPPAPPEMLSFLVTAAFNLDNEMKYELLETRSTVERLKKLREILQKAVVKMEESADIHKLAQTNGHGKKKIDI
ncbi:MAG: LON peptidase substrate-binding domain-containing protein [Pyrinomonadaceae bacterium]|nr:LON peptidase substrate-binding domain-containing protein [Pyrinomonadaceae bacterium]